MAKILVVGDAHVTNNQDLSRFDILGQFIIDKKPSHVVLMGDFLTLNCLSSWDLSKRAKIEGRRYSLECTAGNSALDKSFSPMLAYNKIRKERKKKLYTPEIFFIEGNHEDRLNRYLDTDPTFHGMVSIQKDLKLDERGIAWIPYREYHYINGIGFTHVPFNKYKEISGLDITRKAQGVTVSSVVFGHTHEWHVSNRHCEGMDHLQQTLNCGCFFTDHEDYVHGRMTNYWKGLMLLHSYKHGRFDLETFAMGRLERMYGNRG